MHSDKNKYVELSLKVLKGINSRSSKKDDNTILYNGFLDLKHFTCRFFRLKKM